MSRLDALVVLHRIGPYHHARLDAASHRLRLAALETRPASSEYPWDATPDGCYTRFALSGSSDPEEDPANSSIDRQLDALLEQLQPAVLVSVGWADRAYQRLLIAAQRRQMPLVIVSDSRWSDEPRQALKEASKALLLRGYAAALVAGRESRAYLERLGFPAHAIHQPWDVVDNEAFARIAAQARPASSDPHFLCVSRFVAKKNHAGLLKAYGRYQQEGGSWGLRLIGSGPEAAAIERATRALPHPQRVRLEPFQQFPDLAHSYGEAAAFVLASHSDQWGLVVNEAMAAALPVLVSEACGCAVDLVEPERTGWSFNPADWGQLCALLHKVERLEPPERQAIGAAGAEHLRHFSLEAFALGLDAAVRMARSHPRPSHRSVLAARLLSQRQP